MEPTQDMYYLLHWYNNQLKYKVKQYVKLMMQLEVKKQDTKMLLRQDDKSWRES